MTTTPLPHWLRHHLQTTGTLREDRATRRATGRHCGCGAPVLGGLSAEPLGWAATVDPTPLTPLGEALAHLTGRSTYALHDTGRHYEIDVRDHLAIRAPAGTGPYDVLADHHCHTPPLPATTTRLPPPARRQETGTCPPF